MFQLEQDRLEELDRDALRFGDALSLHRPIRCGGGKLRGGAECVIGLCGNFHRWGLSTIGDVSSPSLSTFSVTVSPGCSQRLKPDSSRISKRQPLPTVPEPIRSPGTRRTSADARATISPKLWAMSLHVPRLSSWPL